MRKMIVVMTIAIFAATGLFANPRPDQSNDLLVEPPLECQIKIKGTYDGKTVDITVTITADNCAKAAGDFLKAWSSK